MKTFLQDRFQILRELIPQNDQKRDKASLLLEVIGYIQFLQERLQVYEGSYHGWTQELTKLVPWVRF
ncbi:Transcription factor BIM2 [Linum perenne]